jgi:hypothetical protein
MAKPLSTEVPSSSVARLFEPGVARAALVEPTPIAKEVPQPTGEVPDTKREFVLTQTADDSLGHLTTLYSKATGTMVSNSHFLRAVLKALMSAMPAIEKEAWSIGKLKRPSNARGREAEREEYEKRIASSLLSAMRANRHIEGA